MCACTGCPTGISGELNPARGPPFLGLLREKEGNGEVCRMRRTLQYLMEEEALASRQTEAVSLLFEALEWKCALMVRM